MQSTFWKNVWQNLEPIFELCNELMNRGTIAAKNEAAEMQKQIKAEDNFKLEPWDWWYYAEKFKQNLT